MKNFSHEARELLSSIELYEIKAGASPNAQICNFMCATCVGCTTACTSCIGCTSCTSTMMDVIIPML